MTAIVINVAGDYDGRDIEKARKALAGLGAEANNSAFATFGAKMQKIGDSTAAFGKKMTTHVSLPLAAIGVAGTMLAADFETTMNTMQVNAQATSAQMESLSALALKMGADTAFSAGEAADAMLELSKGGLSVAEIQGGALASTMNLAATEGMALADAATIVVQSMNTFGLSANKTAGIVDILAAGSVASTAGVQDLADGMKYVGSTAATMHVPIQDAVTALAAMNNAGIDSTTAGTSLNRMFLGLAGTTKKGAATIKEYGLSFYDANGQLKPMIDIVGQLQDKFGGLTDQKRTQALKDLFGVEGMRAANTLIEQGASGYGKLAEAVNKQGIAQELADARMSGTAGALEAMKGSVETAGIAIGQALAPSVNTAAQKIAELTNKFTALSPKTQQTIVGVGALVAALGPVVFVTGKVISGLGSTVKGIGQVAGATKMAVGGLQNLYTGMTNAQAGASAFATPMMKLGGAVRTGASAIAGFTTNLVSNAAAMGRATAAAIAQTASTVAAKVAAIAGAVATGIATAAQWLWNVALTANPIGLVVVAIAAFVAALVIAWNKSETFRNVIIGAWNAIKSVTIAVFDAVKNAIETAFNWIKQHWPLLLGILGGPIGIAAALIIKYWDQIKGAAVTVFNAVKGAIMVGVNAVIDFARKTGEFIGKVIQFYLDLPGKILGVLKGAATWLVDVGKDMIQGLLDGAGSLLSKIGEFFLDKLPGWIVWPFKKALGIASPSKVFYGFGVNIGEGLVNGAKVHGSKVQAAGKGLADAMKKGTKNALQGAIDNATSVKGGMEDRLGKLRDFFTRARDIVSNAFAGLKDRAQSQIDDLAGRLESLSSDAKSYAESIRSAFAVAFAPPTDGKSALSQFRQSIQDAYKFAGTIKNLRDMGLNETSLQNILKAGAEQGQAIADSLLAEGPGAINEVNSLVSALNNQVAAVAQTLTDDQFAGRIATANAALQQAQESYNAIAAREAAQLAQLDALASSFGINTDAMTAILDGGQARIEALLNNEDTATTTLADAVSTVTTGLLETAASMAAKAKLLGQQIAGLETRIQAAQSKLGSLSGPDGKRAQGGPVYASRTFLVGERGPELFTPRMSGAIVNNRDLRSMGGGGSQIVIEKGALQLSISGREDAQQVESLVQQQFDALVAELARELNR